jgi:hypothetical protein
VDDTREQFKRERDKWGIDPIKIKPDNHRLIPRHSSSLRQAKSRGEPFRHLTYTLHAYILTQYA